MPGYCRARRTGCPLRSGLFVAKNGSSPIIRSFFPIIGRSPQHQPIQSVDTQLGYRPKTNAYDAWTVAQYDRYIRDLALFGANSIEIMPPRTDDDAVSENMKLPAIQMIVEQSKICKSYGLDVWMWVSQHDSDYSSPIPSGQNWLNVKKYSSCYPNSTPFSFLVAIRAILNQTRSSTGSARRLSYSKNTIPMPKYGSPPKRLSQVPYGMPTFSDTSTKSLNGSAAWYTGHGSKCLD